MKDYYEILEVDSLADTAEIAAAYRRLARTYHPDISNDAAAAERMRELNEAYRVLSHDDRRAEYDSLFRRINAFGSWTSDMPATATPRSRSSRSERGRRPARLSRPLLWLAAGGAVIALLALVALLFPFGGDDGRSGLAAPQGPSPVATEQTAAPGGPRVLPLPSVMSRPPEVTLGLANAPSTIAGGVLKPVPGPEFVNYGHRLGLNAAGPWQTGTSTTPNLNTPQPSAANSAPYDVEWEFDGAAFEIHLLGNNAYYRLTVNGQFATAEPQVVAANDYQPHFLRVDFGSRAQRRIRLETANFIALDGIMISPDDTVWRPATPPGPRVIVLGDSYVEGQTGSGNTLDSFTHVLGHLLGWSDIWASGSGGTGYLSTGPANSARKRFQDRLQADVLQYRPDIVIVAGGYGDSENFSGEQIRAAAEQLYRTIRTQLPATKLIVLGPWGTSSVITPNLAKTRDAIQPAATAQAHMFIDTYTGQIYVNGKAVGSAPGPWITGTGRAGNPANDGNADFYVSNDANHPTPAGHAYLARRLATAIATAWPQ